MSLSHGITSSFVFTIVIRKKVRKNKTSEEWSQFKKLRTLCSNQCVWKMTRNFDLQDDAKLNQTS